MTYSLPTLSSAGYVQDPAQILDTLLSYFFVADYSQSNAHYGEVASLPYIIKVNSNNRGGLTRDVESTLVRMLGAYYDSVSINVTVEENNGSPESYDIRVTGSVTSKGRQYSLAKLASVANDKLIKTATLTNRT